MELAKQTGTAPPQHLGWRWAILCGFGAMALLAGGTWRAEQNMMHARRQIELRDQAQSAELAVTTLLSTLKDAETGQRGYLLTGDPSYLQPYTAARAQIGAEFAAVAASPLQDPQRQAGLARLRNLAALKLAELARTVALNESGHAAAAIARVRDNYGKHLMDQIRLEAAAQQADIVQTLDAEERRLPVEGNWLWVGLLIGAAVMSVLRIVLQQLRVTRYFAVSTNRLERFMHAFGLGLGIIRMPNGRITVWSQGSERLYGYSAEEAVGRISHELLGTHFPTPLATIEAQLHQEGYWRGEVVHCRRDGVEIRVLSHWVLYRGKGDAEDLVIEVNSDITSQSRTDALLGTILQTAPALIYAKDLRGRMLLANPPTLELLGKPWEEVEGRTDRELLSDSEEAEVIMQNDRRLMRERHSEFLEEQIGADANGTPRVFSSCKAPMFDRSGAVMGMVGVSLEITAKRQIEEKLRQQAVELERAYADMADFAHIIAHDLRAPLRAVKALAGWIAEDVAPIAGPETLSDLKLLGSRVTRMAMLLEGLLSFSRVGQAKAAVEALDIAALIGEIVEILGPPPDMAVLYVGEDLTIRTPRPPLVHVLQNLISNAIKHHDRAQGEIKVHAARTGDTVTFSVADDGPGIPPAAHRKIFDMFHTLAVRPENETSGVGLSIVRKTVEKRGGKVWVESDPGERGAKFIFTWPEGEPAEPAAPAAAPQAAELPAAPQPAAPPTILQPAGTEYVDGVLH